jgi:hypothetical protein
LHDRGLAFLGGRDREADFSCRDRANLDRTGNARRLGDAVEMSFGLLAGSGTGGGARVGAGLGGSDATAPAEIPGPTELRDLDSLNQSTLLSTLSANRAALLVSID